MTTGTLTLTEFVLARIAEDEAQNAEAQRRIDEGYWSPNEARRWKAECAAHRRMIEAAWDDHIANESEHGLGPFTREGLSAKGNNPAVVKHMATIWSDHPDFREDWTP